MSLAYIIQQLVMNGVYGADLNTILFLLNGLAFEQNRLIENNTEREAKTSNRRGSLLLRRC